VSVAAGAYDLPFPPERASHHRELAAAAAAVERACRLCVDVKRSLFSGGKSILEKNDQTPVTIADFGVQALVSLEIVPINTSGGRRGLGIAKVIQR